MRNVTKVVAELWECRLYWMEFSLSRGEKKQMVIRVIPLILASLLLAAHFLRDGNLVLTLTCGLLPLLLLIKKRWSWLAVQIFAYAGGAVWLYTTVALVQQRMVWGMSWARLVMILGGVALFTIWAGYLLNAAPVREKYHPEGN